MFEKKINISNELSVNIVLKVRPAFEKGDILFFGFPFDFQEEYFEFSNEALGNSLKGYWLKLDVVKGALHITTDILGGYRVYYAKTSKGHILISDDFEYVQSQVGDCTKEDHEIQYWKKHRFTTGKGTFYKEILKISPSSTLTIDKDSIEETLYFKDVIRNPNLELHFKKIDEDLSKTMASLKEYKETVVLLFSGGKDSCLLLQYLIHNKIPYQAIFLKTNPISNASLGDLKRARSYAKDLGVVLDEIEINLDAISEEEKVKIISNQPLDKHYNLLHYIGLRNIKKKYGDNIVILNGQSSDSILSFGPSEKSLMSFFRRNMMYFPTSLLSKMGNLLLILKTRSLFKLPKNNEEKLISLFDEYKYTRVLETSKSKAYIDYLKSYIEDKTKNLESFHSKEMYVKIASFCQGSDNQVVVKSALDNNLKVVMPFATPNIIYTTIAYKNEREEINTPKYVLDYILKDKFGIDYKEQYKKMTHLPVEKLKIDEQSIAEMSLLYDKYVLQKTTKND
jgi:asparagine synthetase B (glutamine-hydrolysing)